MFALLLACREPQVRVEVRPAGEAVPLAFVLDLAVGAEERPVVSWTDGDHERSVTLPAGTSWTDRLLVGFRPDREYRWTVRVDQQEVSGEIVTPPLPEGYRPEVTVVTSEPDRMEPGYTLVPYWGTPDAGTDALAVLDPAGEVVYLQLVGEHVLDARATDGGLQLLVGDDSLQIREVDWRGRLLRGFHAAAYGGEGLPVDLPGRLQHDAVALEDGGFVALSARLRRVEGFPAGYDDPEPRRTARIWEDVAVRFGPDGAVQWEVGLADVLDPTRIGFDSLSLREGGYDWGHANAVWAQPDGRIGVSLRHQDAVVLLDPSTGAPDWILAPPANWQAPWTEALLTPVGDLEWPSHQHAARLDADGLVTLFDNGNTRASPTEVPVAALPPATERYSRVVRYAVDEEARTVRQARALDLGSVGGVYCAALGDADPLPGGNLLGVFGRIEAEAGEIWETRGLGRHAVRIVEWDAEGEEVFHVHLATGAPDGGWSTYRAERFEDLPAP